LNNRTQCVKYNNVVSDPLPLSTGVPQGSVFGPLLFNIYVNDLLTSLPEGTCMAYADDVTLIASGSTVADARLQLQSLLDLTATWAKHNLLSFSYSKCNVMLIPASFRSTTSQPLNDLTLNGRLLASVDQVTILGVDITSDLSWSQQAKKVCGKLSGRLAVLRRLGGCLNTNTRRQIFNGFVKPHLSYCLPVWGNTSVASQRLFDKVLTRSVRFILNKHDAVLNDSTFDCTGLCNFKYHVLLSNVTVVFNCLHYEPLDTFSAFTMLSNTQSRCSRATLSGAAANWNSLPNNVIT
jgi:ribonuclease P/MRP protein subunit RPP40